MQPQVLVPPQGEGSEQQAACSKCVLPPPPQGDHPTTAVNGIAWLLLPRGFPCEGQPLWVGRVVTLVAPLSQAPLLGSANHISLTPVISQRVIP